MRALNFSPGRRAGFSLIELCIVTIISGLLLAAGLKAFNVYMKKQQIGQTNARLEKIEDAIHDFARRNGFYPCPASSNAAPDAANYGAATNCAAAPVAGVTEVDGRSGRKVRIGALPVRTLEISDTYLTDGWNKRYTYAVSVPLTSATTFDNNEGAITVNDLNDNIVVNGTAHFALLSHGPDGKGAFASQGGEFMPCTGTAGKDQANCARTNATFRVSQDRSTAPGNDYYDDFAVYGTRVMLDHTEQIMFCNGQKKFYTPDDPAADADGCVGRNWQCESSHSYKSFGLSPIQACVRSTDGHSCHTAGPTDDPWVCYDHPNWPGDGEWRCDISFFSSAAAGLTDRANCIRVTDGHSCHTIINSPDSWVCYDHPNWPDAGDL